MKIHFVGIGGMGLSALALYMKKLGYDVSGSDLSRSKAFDDLIENEISAYVGHGELKDVDVVVRSSAVKEDDYEVSQALKKGIKVMERMEFFSQFVKPQVGVTGTDGKSSTTCMIAWIALKNDFDPTLLCGAFSKGFDNSNFRFGKGPIIAEVDESDPKMKNVISQIAVLTNLRYDHLERYGNDPTSQLDSIKSFLLHSTQMVMPSNFVEIVATGKILKFGKEDGDLRYEIVESNFFKQKFKVKYNEKEFLGELPIPGKYQVENAIAAVGAALLMGIPIEDSLNALKSYPGVSRRLEIVSLQHPVVISDYAHTPSEVVSSVNSVIPFFKSVTVVFEPHRYSRLEREYKNFARALKNSKNVIVTDIFEAFEKKDDVNVEMLINELNKQNVNVKYWSKNDDVGKIADFFNSDLYLFMGAGDVDSIAREFARKVMKK
ncbi:UDP-N-acetylmuramate--L-alanine ligase [Mesoaciditoga sp.]